MPLITFFRNSVISIPIITFLIGISINNYYLSLLSIGLFLSNILNIIIKSFFSQFPYKIFKRPPGSKDYDMSCNDNDNDNDNDNITSTLSGFPSGHSQMVWFFSIFMILYSYKLGNANAQVIIILLMFASVISFSRLGYYKILGTACHTPLQVIVGSILGIILAQLYFKLINKFIKL